MWPFKLKWTPQVGEKVMVNTSTRYEWREDWESAKVLPVEAVGDNGKCFGFHVNVYGYGYEQFRWFKRNRIHRAVVDAPIVQTPPAAPLVDVRVLEELGALRKHLGSTDALVDLLRSIRTSYDGSTVKEA